MKKIIVGITGASGTIYAIDLLKRLHRLSQIEIHLVLSSWAQKNLALETNTSLSEIKQLADYTYQNQDQGAKIASGSFLTSKMIIVPASMNTIAKINYGIADNLITRAADVMLKERRQLIIVPRETPFNVTHLENLTHLAKLGVQIIPPIPAFYNHPHTIQDLIDHQTMKELDALEIEHNIGSRWNGD